jgi:DNA-binding LytR/AlgR family response regulator
MSKTPPTALIAEDEPLLAGELRDELAHAWPELEVCAVVHDGHEAVAVVERLHPHVLFLDVQMPGLSGLEVARLCGKRAHVVFITAFDRYAVQAFEEGAVDYLVKPLQPARLVQAVQRLKDRLGSAPADLGRLLDRLADAPAETERMRWITVLHGRDIRLIAIDDVICFEADSKYIAVITAEGESLITTPLKDLLPGLDPHVFWQIHRGTVVNVNAVETVRRLENGRLEVRLKGLDRRLYVSDRYAHLFRQM